MGAQKNLSPPSTIDGWRESRAPWAPSCNICLGGGGNWSRGRTGFFETLPVSFERILREAREFGRAAAAWMYFLIGEKKKKGNPISKFNFIVMLMVGPSGN